MDFASIKLIIFFERALIPDSKTRKKTKITGLVGFNRTKCDFCHF